MAVDARQVLERLCAERGDDFAGLSRMLGRNPAYIQQFVRRGVPKRLKEEERGKLARYFAISETLLGGPETGRHSGLVSIAGHPVLASAGPGAIVSEEMGRPCFAFDERRLRAMTKSAPSSLSIVRVRGDSMSPTLDDGDDILVDLGDSIDRLRDGIYVLRIEEGLVVKRLAVDPAGRRITVRSDNPAYPDWTCGFEQLNPVGRVIWSGRRIT
jgi:SOS-response transcriptional repressor LexA